MSGMNVLANPGTSDYQNRTVTIEVTGVRQQSVLKRGGYQVRVPYSQMSQAMQTIHRQGGKVASVQVMGDPPAVSTGDQPDAGDSGATPQPPDGSEDSNDEGGDE